MYPHLCLLFLNLLIFNSYCGQEEDRIASYSVLSYLVTSDAKTVVFEKKNGDTVIKCLKEFNEIDPDVVKITLEVKQPEKAVTFKFVRDGKDWLRTSVEKKSKKCAIL